MLWSWYLQAARAHPAVVAVRDFQRPHLVHRVADRMSKEPLELMAQSWIHALTQRVR